MRALSVLSLNLSLGVTFIVTLMTTAVSMARETQSSTPTQVSLVGWVRSADSPVLILPRLQNESPSMAVNAYLSSLQQMESGRFFPTGPLQVWDERTLSYEALINTQDQMTPSLLIANSQEDNSMNGERIQRTSNLVRSLGGRPYVLPLGASRRLDYRQRPAFLRKLRYFRLWNFLGGDDLHPRLTNETVRHAYVNQLSFERDELELELATEALNDDLNLPPVTALAYCRGHEMLAVAAGHSLYQDITGDNACSTEIHVNAEGDNPAAMQTWHDVNFLGAPDLMRFFGPNRRFRVNSVHHAAVRFDPDGAGEVIAVHPESGLVEAMAYRDVHGRIMGISTQWHPEFDVNRTRDPEFTARGRHLIQNVIQLAGERRSSWCESFLLKRPAAR